MNHFARGQFHVSYEERIDFDELRRKRIAKAQAERNAAQFDVLLVWKDENVRYLTDLLRNSSPAKQPRSTTRC